MDASGSGYVTSYQAESTAFTTNFKALGVKAPEQLEDDFLNLFIWTWSLKDYLKSCFETKGLRGEAVEEDGDYFGEPVVEAHALKKARGVLVELL